ncbi:YeeE/YedE family protein [Woodsholea maritima]|uniref:YeeE/YedE family protein n=1 Tax=Woodsholea maritima TaxID=240237 RepID=UPI000475E2C2|nr:YeeE/YedE thiosulfate transporter family protein [Woodsholea maritima]
MTPFTPLSSLFGGALIGISALTLMAFNGQIAGISGILGSAIDQHKDRAWRWAFLAGIIVSPALVVTFAPDLRPAWPDVSFLLMAISALLIGAGTALGLGCTSGHGVCGLSRLSLRSLVATLVFMMSAGLTVFITRHIL